jgi:arabinose-5-phosphate isomerase
VSENLNNDELVALAREVLDIESRAVNALRARLDDDFATACRLINDTPGRVVVTGMGKSGHISSKIAATLASTGTPAFFMHPAEASHGDLGMITENDLVLAISYSGETAEVVTILPLVKRMGAKLISMTGNPKSTLARIANVHLNVAVSEEACPLNLAPTASTTATLAMGDALAVALLKNRGFTAEDFARSHPSGSLGKRLLLRVGDVMRTGEDIPAVGPEVRLRDGLMEMTQKGLADVHTTSMAEVMHSNCKTTTEGVLAAEAVHVLEENKITSLLVADDRERLIGALNIHDLFRAGIM